MSIQYFHVNLVQTHWKKKKKKRTHLKNIVTTPWWHNIVPDSNWIATGSIPMDISLSFRPFSYICLVCDQDVDHQRIWIVSSYWSPQYGVGPNHPPGVKVVVGSTTIDE